MARKLRYNYTFTPATNSIVLSGFVGAKRILLITNLKTNTIIYNFSDLSLTAKTVTYDGTADQTTIVLAKDCSAMSATDNLQIYLEEDAVSFTPSEINFDPVNKFRTSSPQALIDTDFEYGTQISKWENLSLSNNRPFAYPTSYNFTGVGTINIPTGSKLVTINAGANSFPPNGTPITITDTYLPLANGVFVIEQGGGTGIVTYTARAANPGIVTNIFDVNKTGIFTGTTYTGAAIGAAPAFTIGAGIAVTVTTTVPHGLSLGNEIAVSGITGTNPPNGNFFVASIVGPSTFTYYAPAIPTGLTTTSASVLPRPQSQFIHRAFDGGVIFTGGGASNHQQTIRQTRRYFRYQSGKGIQISTGSLMKPNIQIDSLTSVGTTVTVQTKEQHNILVGTPGTTITIFGANESAYNGTFVISGVTGFNKFTYTALSTPSSTQASGNYNLSIANWFGASNRLGFFDTQNGMFFEHDGQTAYVVRRNSTYQISGKVTVTNGSNTVTQSDASVPTAFSKQLSIGNFIVIRGASYRVTDIASDTSLTISPSYRGATSPFAIVSKTIDTRIPQSQWNLDTCDGNGPSGYTIDLSKMQMFYMDFSWYGAGFIRWGVRGPDGNVMYVHKLRNNNVNTEAYMRSGNLPGRYETSTIPPITTIGVSIASTDTTISVASTSGFPSAGTLLIRDASKYEYVNYTGVSGTTFTGVIRARSGAVPTVSIASSSNVTTSVASTAGIQIGQKVINAAFPDGTFVSDIGVGTVYLSQASSYALAGAAVTFAPMGVGVATSFVYSATNPVPVELAFPTYTPTISHWGTSVIMDGRYDDDKSLVFTYGQATSTSIAPGATRALFSIRVSPSVDSGITGTFGSRELVNRMQLVLRTLGVSIAGISTANVLVRAYINSTPSTATTWTNAVGSVSGVVNSSLAQIADYGGGTTTVSGGEVTAGFFVAGTSTLELDQVRDLGNCILGGGAAAANTQIYPDGPDVLTITATNYTPGTTVSLQGRVGWTEAQA